MKVYLWSSSWKIRAEILKQKAQSGMTDSGCLDKNSRELGIHAELKGKCKQDCCFRKSRCCPLSPWEITGAICWIYSGFKNGIYANKTRVSLYCGFGSIEKKNENKRSWTTKSLEMSSSSHGLYCTLEKLVPYHSAFRDLYVIAVLLWLLLVSFCLFVLAELCGSAV